MKTFKKSIEKFYLVDYIVFDNSNKDLIFVIKDLFFKISEIESDTREIIINLKTPKVHTCICTNHNTNIKIKYIINFKDREDAFFIFFKVGVFDVSQEVMKVCVTNQINKGKYEVFVVKFIENGGKKIFLGKQKFEEFIFGCLGKQAVIIDKIGWLWNSPLKDAKFVLTKDNFSNIHYLYGNFDGHNNSLRMFILMEPWIIPNPRIKIGNGYIITDKNKVDELIDQFKKNEIELTKI